MVYLILSLLFVGLVIYLMQKGLKNTYVFLFVAFLAATVYVISTGETPADPSSGTKILDIFETLKVQMGGSFESVGLALMPIYGYSLYMDKIKANSVLGRVASRPVAKSKNPYFVGVAVAIVVCALMRIAIVSAFAIMTLLFTTLYPVMLKAGLSKKTAMASIFLGTCFDWGPADYVIAQLLGGATGGTYSLSEFFLNASIYIVPITIVVTALTAGMIMKYWDKKDGYKLGSDAPDDSEATADGLPSYYSMLPLLPMILIIIFSKVFFQKISISVVSAVVISMIVSLIVETARKKNFKERVSDMNVWLTGMGKAFAELYILVVSIQLFAGMLAKLGGFTWAMNKIMNTGISGWAMVFIFGLFIIVINILIGNGTAITTVLAGQVETIATSLGLPFYALLIPVQTCNAFRCLSIGTGPHTQFCTNYAGCTAMDIVKRTALSCAVIFLLTFAGSYFLLG